MRLSATPPARCWWYARTRAPRPPSVLSSCKEEVDKRPDETSRSLRRPVERRPGVQLARSEA